VVAGLDYFRPGKLPLAEVRRTLPTSYGRQPGAKSAILRRTLGAIYSVAATSGATLAIAQGLAASIRTHRGVTVTIERDDRSGLKAAATGLDPEAAVRIVEIVHDG
jgi:hypothetical protein